MVEAPFPINMSFFVDPEVTRQQAFARRGIMNPFIEDLHPDRHTFLYRPGHSSLSDDENLSSPWWMDFQNFIAIKLFTTHNRVSLTISSRVNNAAAPAFGPANLLFRAKLGVLVRTFRGLGRPITSDGRMYFPPNSITQTFIPGLRNWPQKTLGEAGRKIFPSYTKETIGPGFISIHGE